MESIERLVNLTGCMVRRRYPWGKPLSPKCKAQGLAVPFTVYIVHIAHCTNLSAQCTCPFFKTQKRAK